MMHYKLLKLMSFLCLITTIKSADVIEPDMQLLEDIINFFLENTNNDSQIENPPTTNCRKRPCKSPINSIHPFKKHRSAVIESSSTDDSGTEGFETDEDTGDQQYNTAFFISPNASPHLETPMLCSEMINDEIQCCDECNPGNITSYNNDLFNHVKDDAAIKKNFGSARKYNRNENADLKDKHTAILDIRNNDVSKQYNEIRRFNNLEQHLEICRKILLEYSTSFENFMDNKKNFYLIAFDFIQFSICFRDYLSSELQERCLKCCKLSTKTQLRSKSEMEIFNTLKLQQFLPEMKRLKLTESNYIIKISILFKNYMSAYRGCEYKYSNDLKHKINEWIKWYNKALNHIFSVEQSPIPQLENQLPRDHPVSYFMKNQLSRNKRSMCEREDGGFVDEAGLSKRFRHNDAAPVNTQELKNQLVKLST